jgi:hypothetical protein
MSRIVIMILLYHHRNPIDLNSLFIYLLNSIAGGTIMVSVRIQNNHKLNTRTDKQTDGREVKSINVI